jgi:hypothetical protein
MPRPVPARPTLKVGTTTRKRENAKSLCMEDVELASVVLVQCRYGTVAVRAMKTTVLQRDSASPLVPWILLQKQISASLMPTQVLVALIVPVGTTPRTSCHPWGLMHTKATTSLRRTTRVMETG